MLDTIRAFVAEKLAARPDAAQIQRRHADYYRALAEQAEPALRGPRHGQWLERLDADVGNRDDALRHLREVRDLGDELDSAWLAAWSRVQMGTLAIIQGQLDQARLLLDDALALSVEAHSTNSVTPCLIAFARLAFAGGDPERAALLVGAAEGLRRPPGVADTGTARPTSSARSARPWAQTGSAR